MSGRIVSSPKGFRGLEIWGVCSTALWWEAEKQPQQPGPQGFSQASRLSPSAWLVGAGPLYLLSRAAQKLWGRKAALLPAPNMLEPVCGLCLLLRAQVLGPLTGAAPHPITILKPEHHLWP